MRIKSKLTTKLVMIGMFGSLLTASTYVKTLSHHEINHLFNKLQGTKIEKAMQAGGPTRGGKSRMA